MRIRTTINLALVLMVLMGVWAFVRKHEQRMVGSRAIAEQLVRLPVSEITEITWSCSNRMVRVVRKGGDWFLQRPVQARASVPSVMQLLSALNRTRVRDTITVPQQTVRGLDPAAFGLAPAQGSISLSTPRDMQIIYLGLPVPMGEGMYVRDDRGSEVYAVTGELSGWCALTSSQLRENTVLQGGAASAVRVDLQRSGMPFVQLVREEDNGWWLRQPVHARADQAAVDGVLSALYGLQAVGFEWDPPVGDTGVDLSGVAAKIEEYGLRADEAAVQASVWSVGEGLGQEVVFGAKAGEGSRYAKRRDASSILRVQDETLEWLMADVAAYRDRRVVVLDPDALSRLAFMRGERKVALTHGDEGWAVVEPADWRADAEVVAGVLGMSMGMRFSAFVAKSETNAVPAGVVPYRMQAWVDGVERPVVELEVFVVGEAADALVRLASGEMGLVPPHQMSWLGEDLLDPLVFRDRGVVAVPRDQVLRITQVAADGGRSEVLRGEDGKWHAAANAAVRTDTVESILFYLSNLRAVRAWTAHATPEQLESWGVAGAGLRSLTLGLEGSESIQKTLLFGREAAGGGVYTMVRGQPVVFLLPPLLVKQLLVPVAAGSAQEE
jgi:hypothetical protein